MSSSGLQNMAKRMLDRVNKNLREEVQDHKGQIFIWRRKQFEEAMREHAPEDVVKKLSSMYHNKLVAAEKRVMGVRAFKPRLKEAKKEIIENNIEHYNIQEDELFAVNSFYTVQRIKGEVGSFFHKLTGKERAIVTGAGNKEGQQIGHGEFGHAVSTTQALAAEAVLKSASSVKKYSNDPAYKQLDTAIRRYKETVGVSLELKHYQDVTVRGRLKKRYTPILSSQDSILNAEDAKSEKKALQSLRRAIEKEYSKLASIEGSPSLKDAVHSVTLYNLTNKGKRPHKSKVKPSAKVTSKGRGKASSKVTLNKQVNIISGAGAIEPAIVKATTGVSNMPLFLLGVLNEQLPRTVAKNMHDPRLNNQTGRFAGSVRVLDIVPTNQGFPSVGYTYQREPYEVFETGNSKGNIHRDPRRLIDASIREIAAQYAIGRFYTRRV